MSKFRNGAYEGSGLDLWQTPPAILEKLTKEFNDKHPTDTVFDPCPKDWNGENDGLKIKWPLDGLTFVNPPYSHMKEWSAKVAEEAQRGVKIALLIPVRTDTRYFHDHLLPNLHCLELIKGRVKFVHPETGLPGKAAPFPSMIVYFNWVPRAKTGWLRLV